MWLRRAKYLAVAVLNRSGKCAFAFASGVGQGEDDGAAVGGCHQLDDVLGEAVRVRADADEGARLEQLQ